MQNSNLLGIGLYTAADAGRLLGLASGKVRRWLTGHRIGDTTYAPLWQPQVRLEDGATFLGFRDLMELRTANHLMEAGLSAQAVRRAIEIAQEMIGDERPLSTTRFRTDGRSIFLRMAEEGDEVKILDLFKRQYVFAKVIEKSLKNVEFDGIAPARWRAGPPRSGVVIDPARSFGQPIDDETGVPTAILARAASAATSILQVARDWEVPVRAVRDAVAFENSLVKRAA